MRVSTVTGVSPAGTPAHADDSVELAIGGMTCASCAAQVEKKLSQLDGDYRYLTAGEMRLRARLCAGRVPGRTANPGNSRFRRA